MRTRMFFLLPTDHWWRWKLGDMVQNAIKSPDPFTTYYRRWISMPNLKLTSLSNVVCDLLTSDDLVNQAAWSKFKSIDPLLYQIYHLTKFGRIIWAQVCTQVLWHTNRWLDTRMDGQTDSTKYVCLPHGGGGGDITRSDRLDTKMFLHYLLLLWRQVPQV